MAKKVKPGQPIDEAISARDWNDILLMLDDWKRRPRPRAAKIKGQPTEYRYNHNLAIIYNDTGAARSEGQIVGLGDFVIDPAKSFDAWWETPTFTGETPSESEHSGKFAVLLEPIGKYDYGRAVIGGIAPGRTRAPFSSEDWNTGGYADVSDLDKCTKLKEWDAGTARILAKRHLSVGAGNLIDSQGRSVGNHWSWLHLGAYPPMEAYRVLVTPDVWTVSSAATNNNTASGVILNTYTKLVQVPRVAEQADAPVLLASQQASFDVIADTAVLHAFYACIALLSGNPAIQPKKSTWTLLDWDVVGAIENGTDWDLVECITGNTNYRVCVDTITVGAAGVGVNCVETTFTAAGQQYLWPTWIDIDVGPSAYAVVCAPGNESSSS